MYTTHGRRGLLGEMVSEAFEETDAHPTHARLFMHASTHTHTHTHTTHTPARTRTHTHTHATCFP